MEVNMAKWQLQEAKARLSEVIKSSHDEGPQEVTVRGKPSAVVISVDEYEAMKQQRPGFVEFMHNSPLAGAELVIERSDSPVRDISF
jgi:prevent-host-death family protein